MMMPFDDVRENENVTSTWKQRADIDKIEETFNSHLPPLTSVDSLLYEAEAEAEAEASEFVLLSPHTPLRSYMYDRIETKMKGMFSYAFYLSFTLSLASLCTRKDTINNTHNLSLSLKRWRSSLNEWPVACRVSII
jgi:hypothetical protein